MQVVRYCELPAEATDVPDGCVVGPDHDAIDAQACSECDLDLALPGRAPVPVVTFSDEDLDKLTAVLRRGGGR